MPATFFIPVGKGTVIGIRSFTERWKIFLFNLKEHLKICLNEDLEFLQPRLPDETAVVETEKDQDQPAQDYLNELTRMYPDLSPKEMGKIERAIGLLKKLGRKKQVHSINVSLSAARVTRKPTVFIGALLHDIKEEKPKQYKKKKKVLPKESKALIRDLFLNKKKKVNKKSNIPLEHLQELLPELEQGEKNNVVLIKLCDRLDNLQKCELAGEISAKYAEKSKQLFKYLAKEYQDDPSFDQSELVKLGEEIAALINCKNYLAPAADNVAA